MLSRVSAFLQLKRQKLIKRFILCLVKLRIINLRCVLVVRVAISLVNGSIDFFFTISCTRSST